MIKVYCFSGAGHSFAVAKCIAEKLGTDVLDINKCGRTDKKCRVAVVAFPVYCQNIPENVKGFLTELDSEYVAFAVTYGGISYGNVLFEAKTITSATVIAGALIPTGHTFLNGGNDFDEEQLSLFIEGLKSTDGITVPKYRKNIFADFFPEWRSRISVKINASEKCIKCNLCGDNCPANAIKEGNTNSNCIRCMKCVTDCPNNALSFDTGLILNLYLNKKRRKKHIELFL